MRRVVLERLELRYILGKKVLHQYGIAANILFNSIPPWLQKL